MFIYCNDTVAVNIFQGLSIPYPKLVMEGANKIAMQRCCYKPIQKQYFVGSLCNLQYDTLL